MDRFTLSALAASGIMVGAAAVAAWAPGQKVHALVRPAADIPNSESPPQPEPCPHGPPDDLPGLDLSGLPSGNDAAAAELASLKYAPANRSRRGLRLNKLPAEEEFGWAGKASAEPVEFESEAAVLLVPSTVSDPGPGTRSGGDLEIVEGTFIAAGSMAFRDSRGPASEGPLDIMSPGALAHFAGMNAEQIEAFMRLAAMVRHPELAVALASQGERFEQESSVQPVLPPIGFEAVTLESMSAGEESGQDHEAVWAAVESQDGTVRLVLAGDERTALPVRQGSVVGSHGRVERIVRSGAELAVLFENGGEITGLPAARPPSAPLRRPDAVERNGT